MTLVWVLLLQTNWLYRVVFEAERERLVGVYSWRHSYSFNRRLSDFVFATYQLKMVVTPLVFWTWKPIEQKIWGGICLWWSPPALEEPMRLEKGPWGWKGPLRLGRALEAREGHLRRGVEQGEQNGRWPACQLEGAVFVSSTLKRWWRLLSLSPLLHLPRPHFPQDIEPRRQSWLRWHWVVFYDPRRWTRPRPRGGWNTWYLLSVPCGLEMFE